MTVSAAAYEQTLQIGDEPIIMVEEIDFEPADLSVLDAIEAQETRRAEEMLSAYNRRDRRTIERTLPQEEIEDFVALTGGVIARAHPVMRGRLAYNFMLPMFDGSPVSTLAIQQSLPDALAMAEMADLFLRYGGQVSGLVQAMHTDEQEYQLIRQFATPEDYAAPDEEQSKRDLWKGAFFMEYGPHKDDSYMASLRASLAAGKYDSLLLDELCIENWDVPEVARTLAFGNRLGGDDPSWYDRLLEAPELLDPDMQRLLVEWRLELLKNYDTVTAQADDLLGMIALGYEGKVQDEWQRISHKLIAFMRRNKAVMPAGSNAMRGHQDSQASRKRGKAQKFETDTASADSEIDVTDEQMAEGLALPLAELKYDYRKGEPSNVSVSEVIDQYAGTNTRLREGLKACCDFIQDNFQVSGGLLKGIRRIHKNRAGTIDLWEMKPSEAPGVGNKQTALIRTRLLFTVRDGCIQLVDIVHRDRLPEAIKSLT